MIEISPLVLYHLERKMISIGLENNEYCRHWINQKIYDILPNDTLKQYYLDQCYKPIAFFNAITKELIIKCTPCNPIYPNECRRIFPLIAKVLKDEFHNIFEKDDKCKAALHD